MKDWFVPSIGFGLFVYFMLFVILYTIKIGGANVPLYGEKQHITPAKTDTEKFLQDVSKSVRESF
ncbi:hypothetical protein [Helicobacter winghamensis]|uniref:Uncharacterized protein n=1 Tax=Helicobacter winghamensis TaxID=157268 RepID=A0A2N3PIX5_9HELI|nr:hypothetical protein [Helicobacter winghamensis]EEO25304.1 hypothetical protein HWAG_00096 [Helicobacter winghamensis ATCC BAA-430]PKT76344.1 hypothetical protein BCM35_06390 [Helicobacter winghamensis]PKT76475.1 hypothetical protein BCM32_03545 [Helicobacter winghamensis]PKT76606.1 hypothetical protein BCM34_04920 [Helicobacter winghamensis]PKT80855.1 hypothetical protein BCM31_02530 [Helicobacter winghamensis]